MQLQENLVVADRFRLVRMIGRGGMGSVWQAVHLALDQPCALKFIEGELGNVADAHARFEREAKAAAQLRSPHVVQIIDHGVWQGRPYIAMELLEGEDLGRTIEKAGGKLLPTSVVSIIQQVCRALTRAHQAGIVHRDLKPDNIFLVTDDDRQIVKILDFGVAKQTSLGIDGSNTKTGAMLGTPYYMSPEQAQGIKSVDARSNLWSLAVIVYVCLTGQRPFDSDALGDLLVKIIVQPVPVPSQVAQVPPGFDIWWQRAASRNPDARFPTAKEFAISLAAALGVTEDPNSVTKAMAPPPNTSPLQGTAMMGPPLGAATPQPYAGAVPNGLPANTPPPGFGQSNNYPASSHHLGGSGNPATFSGVEPPVGLPKKGPPVALLALAVFALLGVIGGGLLLVRRSAASGHPPPMPTATESASVPTVVASAAGEPPPVTPTAVAAAETASAAPSAARSTTPFATATAPRGPTTKPTSSSKPTTTTTAATGSAKRPTMGDDRKW